MPVAMACSVRVMRGVGPMRLGGPVADFVVLPDRLSMRVRICGMLRPVTGRDGRRGGVDRFPDAHDRR